MARFFRIALPILIAAGIACGQVAKKANENYQTEQGRAAVAKGLSSADRDKRQRPDGKTSGGRRPLFTTPYGYAPP